MEIKEGKRIEKTDGILKIIQILSLCLFVGVLVAGGLYQLIAPKPTYSESEKRDLAQIPDFSAERLFSGAYFSGIDTYYSDTFPLRELFVTMAADFNEVKGIRYDDIKIYGAPGQGEEMPEEPEPTEPPVSLETTSPAPTDTEALVPTETALPTPNETVSPEPVETVPPEPTETVEPPAETTSPQPGETASPTTTETVPPTPAETAPPASQPPPPAEESTVAPPERVNSVIIYDNQAFECYAGSESGGKRYAGVLSAYAELMPNASIYNILVPTHAQIDLLPTKYGYLTQDQAPLMQTIFNTLDSRIKRVDILPTLTEHSDKYLYYRTDHHWTAEGAFYAYEVFCDVAGQTALTREQCTKSEHSGFLGSLYSATKDRRVKNNPDDVVSYEIPHSVSVTKYDKGGNPSNGFLVKPSASYMGFLGGDNPFMSITTGNTNGRKLLVIKESYGNVFSTIVAGNYEQIYIADSRYCPFNIVDLVNDHAVDDVIFINNMFAATTGVRINEIESLKDKTMKFEP